MIKRQSLVGSSLFPLFRPHHHHHHRLGGCCCCCLMAAASSVFQGRNDALLVVNHHLRRQYHASPNLIGRLPFPFLHGSGVNSTRGVMSVLNGSCVKRLMCLKGSSDSLDGLRKRIDNKKNCHNHDHDLNALRNARTFAPSLPQLILDSEIGPEGGCNAGSRLENSCSGANHRGSPLGFPEKPIPEKVVVAVDVDEVLGNFISALNRFIADRYSLSHSVSEYYVYEFFKIWNCSRDEADIRVHEFFKTSYFKTGIHPIPGARQALQKLSRFCDLSIVTSRQNAIRDHTIEWIEKHYPGLFLEIHFGNHFALEGQSRTKSDICRSLGAKVLIDDNPRYALECAEAGIRVLLFDFENSYPWCKIESIIQHPLVTKVHNWQEVEQRLISSPVL